MLLIFFFGGGYRAIYSVDPWVLDLDLGKPQYEKNEGKESKTKKGKKKASKTNRNHNASARALVFLLYFVSI